MKQPFTRRLVGCVLGLAPFYVAYFYCYHRAHSNGAQWGVLGLTLLFVGATVAGVVWRRITRTSRRAAIAVSVPWWLAQALSVAWALALLGLPWVVGLPLGVATCYASFTVLRLFHVGRRPPRAQAGSPRQAPTTAAPQPAVVVAPESFRYDAVAAPAAAEPDWQQYRYDGPPPTRAPDAT